MSNILETLQSKYGLLVPTRSSAPADRPSTPRQHKFYLDLCEQKRRTPVEGYESMSFNSLSALIEELKDLRPVSDAQLQALNNCLERLAKVNIFPDIDIDSLTGGREGTASKVLDYLFKLVNKHCPPEPQPPSDKQLEYVASMYLCPSVNFEDYGISRWIYLEDGTKRRPTSEEFIAILKESFDRSSISEFINKNRSEFNEWRATRIRIGQLKHILNLLEKHGGSQVDELRLLQLSQEEADTYIEQLLDELKVPLQTSLFEETRELAPSPSTIDEAYEQQYKELENIFFGLMMETGEEIENLDEFVSNKDQIREWFAFLLEKEFITPDRLLEIIESNDLLAEMFQI
ncbi:MAG: hypothetical protein WAP91_01450 [Bacilli bacterium]